MVIFKLFGLILKLELINSPLKNSCTKINISSFILSLCRYVKKAQFERVFFASTTGCINPMGLLGSGASRIDLADNKIVPRKLKNK